MSHPQPGDVYQLTTDKYRWPRDLTTVTDDIGTRYTVNRLVDNGGPPMWDTRRQDGTRAYWPSDIFEHGDLALVSPSG